MASGSSILMGGNIQSAFLEQIRSLIPENIALVDELAEILNISRDSAYRRIRGETVLSLDEAKKLHDRYGSSIDALFSTSSNMALFHHRAFSTDYSMDRWLNSVAKNLNLANSFAEKEIIYAAKDIPIFHYFRLPTLSAFKMMFWLKTLIKDPNYSNLNFQVDVIPKDLLALGSRVWKLYATVPSTEIWSDDAVTDTLKQIEFYRECGFFLDNQMPALLCEELITLIDIIRGEAAEGKKEEGETYKLYENDIVTADNTVFAKMNNRSAVYINYNTMNLLTTLQQSFCEKTEAYLNNLVKSSTLISASAEKERNKFFKKMKEKVEAYKQNAK